MIWAVEIAGPGAPKGRGKDEYRQQKENSGDFEPQDAPYAAERTQEPAEAVREASACLPGSLSGSPAAGGGAGSRLAVGSAGGRRIGGCLGTCTDGLAGDAPGQAHPDAQNPPDGLWSHFDMMVAAMDGALLCTAFGRLPVAPGSLRK